MTFRTELAGEHFELRKGLSYKGTNLVDESEVGLLTIDAFITGGGYKRGAEKPFEGDYKSEYIAEPGDVLLAMTEQQEGLLASPLKVPEDLGGMTELIYSLDVAKVISKTGKISPEFLFNFLRVPLNRRRASYGDTGTTVQRLPYDVIYEQQIPVPSLEEQDKINSFIATLDRKIELNTALASTLEKIAYSLFRSWFIDFDPVKAKMAGEKPVGMDAAIAALFPDSMEDSELGLIPTGWTVSGLAEIGEFRNGLAMQKFPVVDKSITLPVIKIAQLRAGHTGGADIASGLIDSKYVITDGDILFSWSGTLEIEHWSGGPGALNQHLFKVIGKHVPDWFIYWASRRHLTDFREIASSKATTMGHIQRSHLAEAKVAVPPSNVVNELNELMESLVSTKISMLVENRTLAMTRDEVLPHLLSGKLRIPEESLVK
jgi:type I restriction enzyme S subunit